ncbi:hypothetical protein [Prevotella falsenii]|nr:hypothetical protein [Prevotella falsenii]
MIGFKCNVTSVSDECLQTSRVRKMLQLYPTEAQSGSMYFNAGCLRI